MPAITHISVETKKLAGQRGSPDDTLRERWIVRTDERVKWEWLIKQKLIAKYDWEHPDEKNFFVDAIEAENPKPWIWYIDYTYTPYIAARIDDNPLERDVEISMDSIILEEETLQTHDRKPVTTTAGEFFTGVKNKRMIFEYKITKNLATDPDALIFGGCVVNDSQFKIRNRDRAPQTLLVNSVSLSPYVEERRVRFTTLSASLIYDPLKWELELFNEGTVQLLETKQPYVSSSGTVKYRKVWTKIPIQAGKPLTNVTAPVPIDSAGRAIIDTIDPGGSNVVDLTKYKVLNFEIQKPVAFQTLFPYVN